MGPFWASKGLANCTNTNTHTHHLHTDADARARCRLHHAHASACGNECMMAVASPLPSRGQAATNALPQYLCTRGNNKYMSCIQNSNLETNLTTLDEGYINSAIYWMTCFAFTIWPNCCNSWIAESRRPTRPPSARSPCCAVNGVHRTDKQQRDCNLGQEANTQRT